MARRSFARRHRCEAILVAGDLGEPAYSVSWPVPVYWVWGDDDPRLVWRHLKDRGQIQDCHVIPSRTTVTIGEPTEAHVMRLIAYRVGAPSGSLTTVGSRTVNVEPWP